MDTLALSAQENADFALVRKVPGWLRPSPLFGQMLFGQALSAPLDLGALSWEVRFEVLPASGSGVPVLTFSTANGRVWYSAPNAVLAFVAPRSVMAGLAGHYQHRCRVIYAGGETSLFAGTLEVRRAITRGYA